MYIANTYTLLRYIDSMKSHTAYHKREVKERLLTFEHADVSIDFRNTTDLRRKREVEAALSLVRHSNQREQNKTRQVNKQQKT